MHTLHPFSVLQAALKTAVVVGRVGAGSAVIGAGLASAVVRSPLLCVSIPHGVIEAYRIREQIYRNPDPEFEVTSFDEMAAMLCGCQVALLPLVRSYRLVERGVCIAMG